MKRSDEKNVSKNGEGFEDEKEGKTNQRNRRWKTKKEKKKKNGNEEIREE